MPRRLRATTHTRTRADGTRYNPICLDSDEPPTRVTVIRVPRPTPPVCEPDDEGDWRQLPRPRVAFTSSTTTTTTTTVTEQQRPCTELPMSVLVRPPQRKASVVAEVRMADDAATRGNDAEANAKGKQPVHRESPPPPPPPYEESENTQADACTLCDRDALNGMECRNCKRVHHDECLRAWDDGEARMPHGAKRECPHCGAYTKRRRYAPKCASIYWKNDERRKCTNKATDVSPYCKKHYAPAVRRSVHHPRKRAYHSIDALQHIARREARLQRARRVHNLRRSYPQARGSDNTVWRSATRERHLLILDTNPDQYGPANDPEDVIHEFFAPPPSSCGERCEDPLCNDACLPGARACAKHHTQEIPA